MRGTLSPTHERGHEMKHSRIATYAYLLLYAFWAVLGAVIAAGLYRMFTEAHASLGQGITQVLGG